MTIGTISQNVRVDLAGPGRPCSDPLHSIPSRFRMLDRERTDPETLMAAFDIARSCGLKPPYVGNIHDIQRQTTYCPNCSQTLIQRDWYQLGEYTIALDGDSSDQARCVHCQTPIPGHFDRAPGTWGSRRQPVRIANYSPQAVQLTSIRTNDLTTSLIPRSTAVSQNTSQESPTVSPAQTNPPVAAAQAIEVGPNHRSSTKTLPQDRRHIGSDGRNRPTH